MKKDISFIFPCLNEEKTIKDCIIELQEVMNKMNVNYEIIISDNGSTDNSVKIAKSLGVKVVHTQIKGYGSALKNGFANAQGEYIVFADIDGSYPLEYLPTMYEKAIKENADMVIASRTLGTIEKNAMPFLHRYLGTPVLTFLVNFLFRGKFSDINSGFRLMKRNSYQKLNVRSNGMEFASKLLIKALKQHNKIIEIAAGLRVDKRDTAPHLNTWRDGMRHLLFIFSEAPKLFEIIGGLIFFLFSAIFITSQVLGPIKIGNVGILDYHTQLISIIFATLGMQIWVFSSILYLVKPENKPSNITKYLMDIGESRLLGIILVILMLLLYCIISIFSIWSEIGYGPLNLLTYILKYIFIIYVLGTGVLGLLMTHIIKKSK